MRPYGLRFACWRCTRVAIGQRSFSSGGAAVRAKNRNPGLNQPPQRPELEAKGKKLAYRGFNRQEDEEDEEFFKPNTRKKAYAADRRPPPTPSPRQFAESVLTAVMSTPDGEWGGRWVPRGGWDDGTGLMVPRDGIEPIGVPLPPPPPDINFHRVIGPGVVAPHRPAAPNAPNPYTGLTWAQMKPALRRMEAAKPAETRAEAAAAAAAEASPLSSNPRDSKNNKKSNKPGRAVVTKKEAQAAAAEAGPPLRVRYAHEHVLHPFSMRFLDGMAVSMPLPGTSAAPTPGNPYGTASFTGFATQYATGTRAPSLRARPPNLGMSFPHCFRGMMIQKYKAKHAHEPLWVNTLLHHAFPGPLALPKRSPFVLHCMERRLKYCYATALRRRGYDQFGRPLSADACAALDPPLPRPPTTPLRGTVSFDGLVPIVLKLPIVQLSAFMDGIVETIEGILGGGDDKKEKGPAKKPSWEKDGQSDRTSSRKDFVPRKPPRNGQGQRRPQPS